ncbi:MAG: restriction endonuclease [Polyangiaceae bacterium]|nr:restriction endonuclease [Polyangiaceae bacterium]MCW5791815.1 restriction endonuclease [Polyangiaceae bacterium]
MTFTEAAAQVLRLVGKPLHYKEITDVAIEKNLLSHVGKSPEVTMGARLAAVVKKEDEASPLKRVKPGVFALREWDQRSIDQGLADRTPALEYLERREQSGVTPSEPPAASAASKSGAGHAPESEPEDAKQPDAAEIQRAEMAAHAREFFEVEADDDEPILGDEEEAEEAAESDDEGGRRRRKRRRRGKNGDGSDDDLPGYTVSDAPADLDKAALEEARPARESRRDRGRSDRNGERDRGDRGERGDRDRERGERGERDRERGERGERDRERGERDRERGERDERSRDGERRRGDDAELFEGLCQIIAGLDRRGGLVQLRQVTEQAVRRFGLPQDMSLAQGLVQACLRADSLRRSALGEPPRVRLAGGRVALLELGLDGEQRRLSEEIQSKAARYAAETRRVLLRRFQELPPRALSELVMLVFERLGYTGLTLARRQNGGELHLMGRGPDYAGGVATAIVVRRDGKEVGRERVSELRGSLHHYGPAAAGFLVTLGQVLSGAREEAAAAGAAPVMLLDGLGFAALCEQHGVGVVHQRVSLPTLDVELFDALKGGG